MTFFLNRKARQLNIHCLTLQSEVDWVPGDPNRLLFTPRFYGQSSNTGSEPVDANYKETEDQMYV